MEKEEEEGTAARVTQPIRPQPPPPPLIPHDNKHHHNYHHYHCVSSTSITTNTLTITSTITFATPQHNHYRSNGPLSLNHPLPVTRHPSHRLWEYLFAAAIDTLVITTTAYDYYQHTTTKDHHHHYQWHHHLHESYHNTVNINLFSWISVITAPYLPHYLITSSVTCHLNSSNYPSTSQRVRSLVRKVL